MPVMDQELFLALLSLVYEGALIYAQALLLPLRSVRGFVAARLGCWAAAFFFRIVVPCWPACVVADLVLGNIAVPLLFWRASWVRRLVAMAIGLLLLCAGDMAPLVLINLLDPAGVQTDALTAHFIVDKLLGAVLAAVVIVALGYLAAPFTRHLARQADDRREAAFVALPTVQALLVVVLMLANHLDHEAADPLMPGLIALAVISLGVDVLLLVTMEDYARSLAAAEREQLVQAELDACLATYAAQVERAEQASRLRHDMRNHLQTASALLGAGEAARALSYLDEVAGAVDAARGPVRKEADGR